MVSARIASRNSLPSMPTADLGAGDGLSTHPCNEGVRKIGLPDQIDMEAAVSNGCVSSMNTVAFNGAGESPTMMSMC